MAAETIAEAEAPEGAERLEPSEIRALQLRASSLQLRIAEMSEQERDEYRRIMATLRDNDAIDWGD